MARNVIGKWPRKTVISKLKFSLDTNDIIDCIKLSTKRKTKNKPDIKITIYSYNDLQMTVKLKILPGRPKVPQMLHSKAFNKSNSTFKKVPL